jgi:PncC family amidohydrolase
LTSVPGSSRSFAGGIVAYANSVKEQLGVSPTTLGRAGAVSEAVAREMARGVRERLHADVSIATTGIAGPSGGSAEKPVGLVWFALGNADGSTNAWRYELRGEREAVTQRATTIALGILWRHLRSELVSP